MVHNIVRILWCITVCPTYANEDWLEGHILIWYVQLETQTAESQGK